MSNDGHMKKSPVRRLFSVLFVVLSIGSVGALPHANAETAVRATLTVAPAAGAPATSVSVTGQGFEARSKGWVSFGSLTTAKFRTDSRGTFSVSFNVPSTPPGPVKITAVTGRSSSSTSFLVSDLSSGPSLSPPPPGGYFALKPVRSWSSLPTDEAAAALVHRSAWEPRPENATANGNVPSGLALAPHGGVQPIWNDWLLPRVTGSFTGTTDEIIQWAAAKWGLPDDLLRAQAIAESYWYQGLLDGNGDPVPGSGFGDYTSDKSLCPPGYSIPCPLSFGILQVKYAAFHPGVFPHNRDSTAFNVDYVAAVLRGCYEGWETWLGDAGGESVSASNYTAGDIWGCVGRWYSGEWHSQAGDLYSNRVKDHMSTKPWLSPSFSG